MQWPKEPVFFCLSNKLPSIGSSSGRLFRLCKGCPIIHSMNTNNLMILHHRRDFVAFLVAVPRSEGSTCISVGGPELQRNNPGG